MSDHFPPDDDPIIRSLRDQGVRPLHVGRARGGGGGRFGTTRNRAVAILAIALVVLLVLVPAIATRLSDWLWYDEIGFERVFLTKVIAQWTLGLIWGVIAFVVLYANARLALRGMDLPGAATPQTIGPRGRRTVSPRQVVERLAAFAALPGTLILSFLFALVMASQWRTIVQLVYRTPFGTVDPVFGRDVGYYVFVLPAIELACGAAMALLIVSLFLIALPGHLLGAEFDVKGWRLTIGPAAQTQLAVLAGLFLLVLAVRIHFVSIPGLLFEEHLPLSGASYVDLHAKLPALHILSITALAGAALTAWGAWRGRLVWAALRAGVAYVAVALLGAIIPAAYQRLVVQPNELARETPQILHHIRATRQAWGIDSVQQWETSTESRLTPALIAANRATIDNVRLWDREPLLQTFGQIQSIRTYYDFISVDDDRYRINGRQRQVLLSPRELNTDALPTKGFINEHLTYTHGMGLTLGPSNEVTPEGLPVLFVKDLPPASSVDLRIKRPEIYYGEQSNDFVLAPSGQREFDYPAGESEQAVYSTYDGKGGVSVGSFARRLLYAVRFGSFNILLSNDLTARTRILYHRDIRERAQRALPFLYFDRDPYMVIANDGRLKWILDAYTATDHYPYAEPIEGGVNYMRNSVKVVIDAYDGTVLAYLTAPEDPIIRTLSRIYPGLLQPLSAMPADLRAHIRYPEDLFRVQTQLYATYHMADPETFYHREDQWQVPNVPETGGPVGAERRAAGEAFMRHMVMRLPNERDAEFILMRPFTPRQKDNLAAWMVARNDGAHYGQLAVYRFPRQSLVFGPNQIVNRINQDTEVSRQITLWDQRGSEVLRGELLVLPIEGSLVYVQPLYLRAQGGRIPELKRVVAAHEGRVSMAETLDAALTGLFDEGRSAQPIVATADSSASVRAPVAEATASASLARQALDHYDRARAAQRADDWATYGEEMRKLGDVLRQIDQARAKKP